MAKARTHGTAATAVAAPAPAPRADLSAAHNGQTVVEDEQAEQAGDDTEIALSLTQDDVNRLSALVGRNILTRDDLISQVAFLTCVSVDGTTITLEPGLLSRLKSRCYKTEFPVFLRETVKRQLADFAGW